MRLVSVIINPQSGQDYPILPIADRLFKQAEIEWRPCVLTKEHEAVAFATQAIQENHEAVYVYGGDGTVMEVARTLQHSPVPLGIIPGGTANVLSKEIGMPQNPEEALGLLVNQQCVPQKIDMGTVNNKPFVLRINIGMLGDMVVHTDRERKDRFGNFAYTLTALENYTERETISYQVTVDDVAMSIEGVSLVITNAGNIGIAGFQFDSHISISDGLLDVLLIKEADMISITKLLAGFITQTKPAVLEHWHGKEIFVELDKPRSIIIDDEVQKTDRLHISIVPQSLNLLVPKTDPR